MQLHCLTKALSTFLHYVHVSMIVSCSFSHGSLTPSTTYSISLAYLPQMDAVVVSSEMHELTEFFPAFWAAVIPDFIMDPENVFPQHFVLVVALIAQMTSVFPFVVVDRVDVDLQLFPTN